MTRGHKTHPIPFLTLLIVCVLVASLQVHAQEAGTAFLPPFEDLPLMPGFAPVQDSTILFDAPGGRIMEAEAEGEILHGAALDFYAETLPQMGWQMQSHNLYIRDMEHLSLNLFNRAGKTVLRFYLTPEP